MLQYFFLLMICLLLLLELLLDDLELFEFLVEALARLARFICWIDILLLLVENAGIDEYA